MSVPEASLCYVGIDRNSAAFRLMKQMGVKLDSSNVNARDGKKEKGLGKKSKGSKDTSGWRTSKTLWLEHILGIGTEKPNAWAFDTTQFDGILKKLKVQAIEINNDKADKKDKVKAKKVEADKQNKASKNNHDTAVKVTRPQGRYKRREKGKLVQAYSSQDLEGILDQDVPPGWWEYKYGLIAGGLLGAESRRKKDKATTGKQGLGIKDLPKKINGCFFEGKKTTFDDSDDNSSSGFRSSVKRKQDENLEMEEDEELKRKLKKLCRWMASSAGAWGVLRLEQLHALIDEHSPSTFSGFSSKEALTFLKHKI